MHVLRLHISIQSLINEHVPLPYLEPLGWSYLQTYNEIPVTFTKPEKKTQLCRTDRNRNTNQSGSSRWYVWKANFFPLLSFIDFTPPSQWLWVIVRWANVPTCCSSSPFICLYPFFLLSRRLVKLLEQLLNFSASCCWTFSPLCHLSNYPLWFSWDLNIQA